MRDSDGQKEAGRVAVIGTGIMTSAMARNLLAAGLPTTVWDRSSSAVDQLAAAGAQAAVSPGEAVAGANVVITMLPAAAVVESVMIEPRVTSALANGGLGADAHDRRRRNGQHRRER
jgi:3-hydroxyisobutyrate dehydrogenase-like beta-hydroxyacid dehydrogenase